MREGLPGGGHPQVLVGDRKKVQVERAERNKRPWKQALGGGPEEEGKSEKELQARRT